MSRLLFVAIGLIIPSWTSPTPLLIIKTARSGSTWFTALLNKLEEVYIIPEIIPWEDRFDAKDAEETNGEITSYLIESLKYPMLKWPAGKDLIRKRKTVIIGCTFNPRVTSVSPERIAKSAPNLQVVALLRSNVVKHAISFVRMALLKKKCHRNQQFVGGCLLKEKTTINIQEFHWYLMRVIYDDMVIVKMAQELSGNLGHSFLVIWYEYLQKSDFELSSLIQWLGLDMKNLGVAENYKGPCYVNCTKITSDDLRLVIANYEELESWIKSTYPCLSSQFYDRRPGRVQPSVSILCGDLFANVSSFCRNGCN